MARIEPIYSWVLFSSDRAAFFRMPLWPLHSNSSMNIGAGGDWIRVWMLVPELSILHIGPYSVSPLLPPLLVLYLVCILYICIYHVYAWRLLGRLALGFHNRTTKKLSQYFVLSSHFFSCVRPRLAHGANSFGIIPSARAPLLSHRRHTQALRIENTLCHQAMFRRESVSNGVVVT